MHYTSFVIAELHPPTPVLVLAPETAGEIDALPLVTSLHRIGNEIMAYVHASPLGYPFPVTDRWIRAVDDYDAEAKIVLALEPLPPDIATGYAPIGEGVDGEDLPGWAPGLILQKYKAATRDVPVSSGTGIADILIDLSGDHADLARWTQVRMGPA